MKIKLEYGQDNEFFTIDKFMSGEPRVQIKTKNRRDFILQMQKFDYPLLANTVDALRRLNVESIRLLLPYFPAARQDRVCNEGEALSVKVYADMINALRLDSVTIMDSHSTVALALINNVIEIPHGKIFSDNPQLPRNHKLDIISEFWYDLGRPEKIVVVAPDAGASKKVQDAIKRFRLTVNEFERSPEIIFAQGSKVRDVSTGQLSGFGCDLEDFEGLPTIVLDDVNCRAGTFLGLGEVIKKRNTGHLSLFTTHADCKQGIYNIINNEYYDKYYTTNSEDDWGSIIDVDPQSRILKVFNVF